MLCTPAVWEAANWSFHLARTHSMRHVAADAAIADMTTHKTKDWRQAMAFSALQQPETSRRPCWRRGPDIPHSSE